MTTFQTIPAYVFKHARQRSDNPLNDNISPGIHVTCRSLLVDFLLEGRRIHMQYHVEFIRDLQTPPRYCEARFLS